MKIGRFKGGGVDAWVDAASWLAKPFVVLGLPAADCFASGVVVKQHSLSGQWYVLVCGRV